MLSGWSDPSKVIGASNHLRYLGVTGVTALIFREVSYCFRLDSYAADPPYIMFSWCSGSGNTVWLLVFVPVGAVLIAHWVLRVLLHVLLQGKAVFRCVLSLGVVR